MDLRREPWTGLEKRALDCGRGPHADELRHRPWRGTAINYRLDVYGALAMTGLRRTRKSCQLQWLNYLRPERQHHAGGATPHPQTPFPLGQPRMTPTTPAAYDSISVLFHLSCLSFIC
ncbi:Myb family transcription factor [Canna indica]|uniref:Myb family transcription factor n=1 Tax=Canna indica TaxID=4628 RepID=A0AAQ3L707_9LILI|nr:Myb family transcription factor [Canna indica]